MPERPNPASAHLSPADKKQVREEARRTIQAAAEHPEIPKAAVEAAAEALWNEREYRDPTGLSTDEGWCPPGYDVEQKPPNEPYLWEQMVAEGKYEASQKETREDAATVLRAALPAIRRAEALARIDGSVSTAIERGCAVFEPEDDEAEDRVRERVEAVIGAALPTIRDDERSRMTKAIMYEAGKELDVQLLGKVSRIVDAALDSIGLSEEADRD